MDVVSDGGIPPDHLPVIFDPFIQVETGHTRSSDGSGLGLTISRRLARLMSGDLTVRSTIGNGSVFTLWLPAATSQTVPFRPEWQERAPGKPRVRGLADVGELVLHEIETILEGFTLRLRRDEKLPAANELKFSQLSDHIPSYLADLGGILIAIDEASGQPSGLLTDGTEIQRLIADRHGAQRARLGWNVEAVRCEYRVLREEMTRVIRRRARAVQDSAIDEGLTILNRVIEQAEEFSVRGFQRASLVQKDEVVSAPPFGLPGSDGSATDVADRR